MSDVLTDFFTPGGMFAYFLGVASAAGWHVMKHRLRRERFNINWNTLGILAAASAVVFMGVQNTQLATEVQDCQREFNTALKQRSVISLENDQLSQEQRHWLSKSDEAIGDLINRVTSPVNPEIAAMEPDDPRRLAWEDGLVTTYKIRTATYRSEIVRIEREQALLQAERERHPLPEPTCGADRRRS